MSARTSWWVIDVIKEHEQQTGNDHSALVERLELESTRAKENVESFEIEAVVCVAPMIYGYVIELVDGSKRVFKAVVCMEDSVAGISYV